MYVYLVVYNFHTATGSFAHVGVEAFHTHDQALAQRDYLSGLAHGELYRDVEVRTLVVHDNYPSRGDE